jgi:hypothetical protein
MIDDPQSVTGDAAINTCTRWPSSAGSSAARPTSSIFQVHLVASGASWPALNQIVYALRFFYRVTLGQAELPERIAHARDPQKLPVGLSPDEVVCFWKQHPT